MRRFDYYAPTDLVEATRLLAQKGEGGHPLAGGTDLIVQMKERSRNVPYVVSLRKVPELQGFSFDEQGNLRIGSMATAGSVAWSPEVKRRLPGLMDGVNLIGSVQIRNKATVGGNLCNASPANDSAPTLIALGATVRIAGESGTRTIPLQDFFAGPNRSVLAPGEVLVDITVPAQPARSGNAYLRHTVRREMDIAFVGVGVWVQLAEDMRTIADARVALGAVAPTPIRSPSAEQALIGKELTAEVLEAAGEGAANDARPINDVRASADYRRDLLRVYTKRVATIAYERARGSQAQLNGH